MKYVVAALRMPAKSEPDFDGEYLILRRRDFDPFLILNVQT